MAHLLAPASMSGASKASGRNKRLRIVVSPAFDRHHRRRHDHFEVRVFGDDEIICVSRQPLLDASRVFLERGVAPSTVIAMVHAGNPTVVALKSTIGVAGEFDVMGSRFVRRKPPPGPMRGASVAASGPATLEHPEQGAHVRLRHKAAPAGPARTQPKALTRPGTRKGDTSAPTR